MNMRYLVVVVFLLINHCFYGQVVIDQYDMPGPGDTIRVSQTVNLGAIDLEETGPDQVWDFTSLFPVFQSVDSFVAVNQTPFVYQLFFFLTADLAQRQAQFNQFQGFQVTDSYRFLNTSTTAYREVGFGVTINGIPLPTLYDDPDVIYNFPLSAGSVDSATSNYTFSIPGIAYFGGWKKRKNTVDGWGTLTTPYGTFETLRLKSEILQFDSIYIDSLGFGFPVTQEYTEYKWLATEMGIPVVEVVDNGLIQSVTYIDSLRNIFTGIEPVDPGTPFQLYPNPAKEQVSLYVDTMPGSACRIELFDISGLLVFSKEGIAEEGVTVIDLEPYQLKPGLYFVLFSVNELVWKRKLIVL